MKYFFTLLFMLLVITAQAQTAQDAAGKQLKEASVLHYSGLASLAAGAAVIYIGNSGDSRMEEGTMWAIGAVAVGGWLVCDIFAWKAIRNSGQQLQEKTTAQLQLTPAGLVLKF